MNQVRGVLIGLSLAVAITAAAFVAPAAHAATSCIPAPANCQVSSRFGPRFHPVLKVWKMHQGTDFACSIGTPVSAVESGQIGGAFMHFGGGNVAVLDAASGTKYKYMHMLRFSDASAHMSAVNVGTLVGMSGNTGKWTTGPHLHFEACKAGAPTDPERMLCDGKPASDDDMGDLPAHDNPAEGSNTAQAAAATRPMTVDMDGSLLEMYDRIIDSRSLNPDYPAQLATLPKERLYAEVAYLESASLKLANERKQMLDRIEVMRALRQILVINTETRKQIKELRARATSSKR